MRFYLFTIVCLMNLSFSCKNAGSNHTFDEVPRKKYLALGDSYTIGESVSSTSTYPQLLVDRWNERGAKFENPKIIAQTGWTTQNLINAIKREKIDNDKYDAVSLLIGVNNQFQGRSSKEFEQEFIQLLTTAINFCKSTDSVFVLSIPDYGFTPFGKSEQAEISTQIDLFNNIIQKVCEQKGIRFVNITPISRKGLQNPQLVANDGLHPSGKMYAEFVDEIVSKK